MLQRTDDAAALSNTGAGKPGGGETHKTSKKKKKKHKATHSVDDDVKLAAKPSTESLETAKIRKLVVKQQSTSELQTKTTIGPGSDQVNRAASSSAAVIPTAGRGGVVEEEPPNERPLAETQGYSTGVYRMLLETKRAELLCESAMLTYRQVAHLRKLFDSEDTFLSGEITREEFFTLIGEEKRKLTLGIFEYVGLEKDIKRLKFDDFVVCVVTFSILTRPELLHYAFTLFDQDASGAMDERELREFCGDLKNKGFFFEKNVQIAQKKMVDGDIKHHGRTGGDGLVDYQDIANGSTQFPVAFYPILQFQRNIRAATLGEQFWIQVEERKQRIEVLVHHMRLQEGHLPSLSIQERIRALWNREVYGLRKIAVVKYTEEKRIWDLENAKAAVARGAQAAALEPQEVS
ncbi:hypothetical protein Gpo141_00003414 [Globisporangium polare]